MESLTFTLTGMANGGAALGRDENQRVIFVPLAIPGETVRVAIVEDKGRFAHGRLLEIVEAAPERIEARCPHFGPCGGCHFQHIDYPQQLRYKEAVVQDQLQRIGRLIDPPVETIWANPDPWAYANSVTFSQGAGGQLGFWSPSQGQVMAIDTCLLIHPRLLELYQDLDLDLPGLTSLALRVDDESQLLAVFETDDAEAPSLEADFPVSAALLLPDGTAANLIGENSLLMHVSGRPFQVSAGCYFRANTAATEFMVETLLKYASLRGNESVLELYCGVGTLTAFLADEAAEIIAVEADANAVADAASNLAEFDNITLYQGLVEEVAPILDTRPDIVVLDPPPTGAPVAVMDMLGALKPAKVIYISADIATLARDGQRLAAHGYTLERLQPVDVQPQTFHVQAVSLWSRFDQLGS